MQGWAGLMEMKGTIDLKYLEAMGSLDLNKLADYLPIDDFKEDMEALDKEKHQDSTEESIEE